ncbi:radical SAM protein [Bacteroidota bacterium]
MKLFLINPTRGKNSKGDFWDFKFEKRILGQTSLIPLSLPTVAGATPKDIETTIIDEKVDEINFDEKVDIVGIGAMTPNITRAYEIADEFRKRGVTVVMGGIHASMMPDEALKHADSVVIGEADCLWRQVINDFKEGKLQKSYRFTSYPELEDISAPRYDLVKSEKYVINQVQTSRGCPFDCDFCSVKAFSGQQFRLKNIEQVVEEIKSLYPNYVINILGYDLKLPKTLLFADDNIIGNKSYSRKLFKAIMPLKLSDWYCQSSINVGRDNEMLSMMKEAGCQSMIIGIESVNPETLMGMDKKINKVDEYYECIYNIQSHGIKVLGSFVLGSDAEDDSIFEKTVKFIKENNLIYNMINILTPLPGTRLFERLESEDRILHKDWERYNFESVCFKPKQMSVETLAEGRRWVNKEIYALNNIHERYENFLKQKDNKEVKGFEESFTTMTFGDKVFSAAMLIKILYKVNSEQRRFLLGIIKKHFEGKETNFGNAIAELSFNDYAFNL